MALRCLNKTCSLKVLHKARYAFIQKDFKLKITQSSFSRLCSKVVCGDYQWTLLSSKVEPLLTLAAVWLCLECGTKLELSVLAGHHLSNPLTGCSTKGDIAGRDECLQGQGWHQGEAWRNQWSCRAALGSEGNCGHISEYLEACHKEQI